MAGRGEAWQWKEAEVTAPRLLALDLSLTATGIAYTAPRGRILMTTFRPSSTGVERRRDIIRCIAGACYTADPQLAVIERLPGYGKGDTTIQLAKLHGVVEDWLYVVGIPWCLVDPKVLKVYATGTGAGRGEEGKKAVKAAVEARYGRTCGSYDEADALAMLGMAADAYHHALPGRDGATAPVPERCRRALFSVDWPALKLPASPPGGPPQRSAPPGGGNTSHYVGPEWSVDHPGIGVLPYPDKAAAITAAGTAGTALHWGQPLPTT